MNCCICGAVKNCEPYLKKVFENIEKIGSLFDDYKIVIYYDSSTDNTLNVLKEYQIKNPKLLFYVNKNPISPYRTHRLANARNNCLNFIKQNNTTYPYFIMMDFDDVNCKNINIEILKKNLMRGDWDSLSFNTTPYYYDTWALSIQPFYFSYLHLKFNNNYNGDGIIKNYMGKILKNTPKNYLIKCLSAFGGFSIYRTNKFLNTYYDGRVRTDLFPQSFIKTHAFAQKSKGLIYKDYGHVKGRYEDCEHRSFHQMARKNSGARIMISPEVLFS